MQYDSNIGNLFSHRGEPGFESLIKGLGKHMTARMLQPGTPQREKFLIKVLRIHGRNLFNDILEIEMERWREFPQRV